MSQVSEIDEKMILSCFDEAMQSVFESYFFLEVLPGQEAKITEEIEVELSFRGPFSGLLHLSLSRETALELARTLPLPSPDLDEGAVSDVFAEIANAIGGRIAASLAGEDFAFDLTIPQVSFHTPELRAGLSLARSYATDFGPLLLSVSHLKDHKLILDKGA